MQEPRFGIQVKPILESIAYILDHHASVARFGDGEIDLMTGHSIPYQDYDPELADRLKAILETPSSSNLLVCLSDVFQGLDRYNDYARLFWEGHFEHYQDFYQQLKRSDWYGSTFLSRPYIDLVDKGQSRQYFEALKSLWRGRDILIVEGETTRSGVGNDLYDEAHSIARIIGPSKNAYRYYDYLLEAISEEAEDRLVILSLGPTAKLLAADLAERGIQALDLGHIDSEYEWFKMGATEKVKLDHKHTAEFNYGDEDTVLIDTPDYHNQVILSIGIDKRGVLPMGATSETLPLISVIVPVYNVEGVLSRCVQSLLDQTYPNVEIILVNDGSTDSSALLCNDYASKHAIIRVYHQCNAGAAAARNKGLAVAKGEYITFVDSDDFVDSTYLATLYGLAHRYNAAIASLNYTAYYEESRTYSPLIQPDFMERLYTAEEWLGLCNEEKNVLFIVVGFTTMKLFHRHIFEGGLRFNEALKGREDEDLIWRLCIKGQTIAFYNTGDYIYSQRAESLSHNGSMHQDLSSWLAIHEEKMATLAMLGFDMAPHIKRYQHIIDHCHYFSLTYGQVDLYEAMEQKKALLALYQEKPAT